MTGGGFKGSHTQSSARPVQRGGSEERGLFEKKPGLCVFGCFGVRSRGNSGLRNKFQSKFGSFTLGNDVPRKAPAIKKALHCSLEDLYSGTTKKMKISRDVIDASGRERIVEELLEINIKPGWKIGTKITFPEKGNDVETNVVPADITFIIDEKPHRVFKRVGNDLIVTRNISLEEALTGSTTQLRTLDGRDLTIRTDSITGSTHEEVVKGEGMPIQNEPSKKGNLIVKFNIKFPTIKFPKLTSEQKTGIKQLLKSA